MPRASLLLPLWIAPFLAAAISSALAEDFLLSDWEDRLSDHTLNGSWSFITDQDSQGESKVISGDTLTAPASIDSNSFAPGYGGSNHALKMGFILGALRPVCGDSCTYDPEVAVEATLGSDTASQVDLTGATGFSFYAKADKPMKIRFTVSTPEVLDYAYYGSNLDITTDWALYTVAIDSSAAFSQPDWRETPVSFNPTAVTGIAYLVSKENNAMTEGTLFLDDIKIVNWTKPVSLAFKARARHGGRAAGMAMPAAGLLKVAVPGEFRKTAGVVEVFSAAGVRVAAGAFRMGADRVELKVGNAAGMGGPLAFRVRAAGKE